MEEVGLKVKNIRFYKSQPWSFSDTLLFGFFCDLDGDDTIRLDEEELALAEWHERCQIPDDAYEISLTREMMTLFKNGLDEEIVTVMSFSPAILCFHKEDTQLWKYYLVKI